MGLSSEASHPCYSHDHAFSCSCFWPRGRGSLHRPCRRGRVPHLAAAGPRPHLLPQEGRIGLRRGRLIYPHLRLPACQHQAQQSR